MQKPLAKSLTQRGIYVPFVAFSLIAILAFCGLAIDTGMALVRRSTFHNAIDTAAIASVYYLNSTYDTSYVAENLRQHAYENIRSSGLQKNKADLLIFAAQILPSPDTPGAYEMHISGRVDERGTGKSGVTVLLKRANGTQVASTTTSSNETPTLPKGAFEFQIGLTPEQTDVEDPSNNFKIEVANQGPLFRSLSESIPPSSGVYISGLSSQGVSALMQVVSTDHETITTTALAKAVPAEDEVTSGPDAVPLSIAIVIDKSGSMNGWPIERAKSAVTNFIRSLANTTVAKNNRVWITIIAFNCIPEGSLNRCNDPGEIVHPLSEKFNVDNQTHPGYYETIINKVHNITPSGGTPFGEAHWLATNHLLNPFISGYNVIEARKYIIFVSDGLANRIIYSASPLVTDIKPYTINKITQCPPTPTTIDENATKRIMAASNLAHRTRITTFTVGFAHSNNVVPVELLQQMANDPEYPGFNNFSLPNIAQCSNMNVLTQNPDTDGYYGYLENTLWECTCRWLRGTNYPVGKYFHSPTGDDLVAAFNSIFGTIVSGRYHIVD
jgi:hypothetical protein